jgi:hypothetical protein
MVMRVHQPRRHEATAGVDHAARDLKPLTKFDNFAADDPDIAVPKLRPGVVHRDDDAALRIRRSLTPPHPTQGQRLGMESGARCGEHAPAAMGRPACPVGDDTARRLDHRDGAQMS